MHTASSFKIKSNATELDQPNLNGDASAMIKVVHNLYKRFLLQFYSI